MKPGGGLKAKTGESAQCFWGPINLISGEVQQ